jgi:predicted 3-demethylubiquinone-9 3-methyltransferase (glyoxalase superfamily)
MATNNVTPFIWLEKGAAEARDFYLTQFPEAQAVAVMPDFNPGEPMGITMKIADTPMILFNGGPGYPQTIAFSMMVTVDTQDDVDRLWDGLIEGGGEHSQCGWLQDRFGLWWQIIPAGFMDVMGGPDADGRDRAREAMLKMTKLDLAELQQAYDGAA